MALTKESKTQPKFRRPMKLIISAFLSLAALLAGTSSSAAESKTPAPNWQLSDVDGKPVKLSDFKGKVIILDFWATRCPPCRAEIPGFVAIQKKYADKGFTVIGVSLDKQGAFSGEAIHAPIGDELSG